jgi:hypothetical protein
LRLPPRDPRAEGGRAFLARAEKLSPVAFESAIYEAVASGNVPSFERPLLPMEMRSSAAGRPVFAVVHVMCDYLAVGSDDDFLRVPMTPATAQRICELTDCTLPTPKLVNEIHARAAVKLRPLTMQAGATTLRRDIAAHHRSVEVQRVRRGHVLGTLISGIKKDLVLSNHLAGHLDRVVIYGWHKEDGEPIQRVSNVHGKTYADYSHGVRLVDESMEVDGRPDRVTRVLRDHELCGLLSDEGALRVTAYPT